MRKVVFIFFLIYSKLIIGQADLGGNWNSNNTDISIDKTYLLKDTASLDGVTYNYMRAYPNKKFIEYGTLTPEGKASGKWFYLNSRGTVFLQGAVENGYKIGKWTSPTGTYYKYEWTANKSSTELVDEKIVNPKMAKRKGLQAK